MAKGPKKGAVSNLNMVLLKAICDATAAGGFVYVSADDAKPFLDNVPPLIVQNAGVVEQGTGKIATKASDAGIAMVNAPAPIAKETAAEEVASYQIFSGVVLPPSKRGGNKAGAPLKYPFDKLEVGQGFFEPISAKMPDPVKTLSSTVSSVNKRYAKPTGETKTVNRTKRGPGNKAVIENGVKVKEQVVVPVTKAERKFVVRVVKAGDKFGDAVMPADGAFVSRVAVE